MKTKTILMILGALVVLLVIMNLISKPSVTKSVLTEEQAIEVTIVRYPELAEYKTTDIPPSSIETKQSLDGWYLGFIKRGSGVSGVLSAKCYYVSNDKNVSSTGEYVRGNSAGVEQINLETCEGVAKESPAIFKPSKPIGKCYVSGCSSQICSDQEGIISTCEYREEYACYKTATCERQSNGQCGWTETSELSMCLNARKL